MLWIKKHASVAGPLIIGIALLLPGGVSQALGESLIVKFEVSEPEFLEVSQPEFQKVYEPEFQEVSELNSLEISEPKYLESVPFPRGKHTPPKQENAAYLRCAKEKGFDDQYKCALGSLGLTQEEIN